MKRIILAGALAVAAALAAAQEPDGASPVAPDAVCLDAPVGRFTPREIDVLRLLIEGQSDKEIAVALSIARRTASQHVATLLTKLGARSRTAAATIALRCRLV
jgi:DNA-binding NarL/FixJ family response regulator